MSKKYELIVAVCAFLLLTTTAESQAPTGFRWINLKQDQPLVLQIEQALKSEDYTAIREIGMLDDSALVMTVHREPDQPTPVGDQWSIYSVSIKSWNIALLVTGYNLEIKDWITFQAGAIPELGVMYLDCWECEPAPMFTSLHYGTEYGWRARWVNKENPKQPGVVLAVSDVGDPYTNEDVDQVFAVFAPSGQAASVGTWYHSRDLGSGKITDNVTRFLVDPANREDKSETLHAATALNWKRELCQASDAVAGLLGGQDSRACKQVVKDRLGTKNQASAKN